MSNWRIKLAGWIESKRVQRVVLAAIHVNAIVLGLYTDPTLAPELDPL